MQTKIFLYAAFLSAISFAAGQSSSATTTTPPTPSQSSDAVDQVNKYFSGLREKSEYAAFSSYAINTAIPTKVSDIAGTIPTLTAAPEFSQMPKDAQDYYSSVDQGVQSVIGKALNNGAPQPTGILLAAGAAAAGVMGIAAMM